MSQEDPQVIHMTPYSMAPPHKTGDYLFNHHNREMTGDLHPVGCNLTYQGGKCGLHH